jgi:catechol 2,3-dioxygenase-like lactoylglutathione lyase family enzyme
VTMLDHLSIQCDDLEASRVFYDAVLEPLGGGRVMEFGPVVGYVRDPDGNNVEAVCHSPES